jgi:hypothetical protein
LPGILKRKRGKRVPTKTKPKIQTASQRAAELLRSTLQEVQNLEPQRAAFIEMLEASISFDDELIKANKQRAEAAQLLRAARKKLRQGGVPDGRSLDEITPEQLDANLQKLKKERRHPQTLDILRIREITTWGAAEICDYRHPHLKNLKKGDTSKRSLRTQYIRAIQATLDRNRQK